MSALAGNEVERCGAAGWNKAAVSGKLSRAARKPILLTAPHSSPLPP